MSDVGAGKSRAGGAVAVGIEGAGIVAVLSALDIQPAVAGEDSAVPPHPCRSDAVEEVDAATDPFHEILGESDPHQVAWMRFGERVVDDLDHLVHRVLLFTNRQ